VGRSVQTVTLKALLRPPALERLSGGDHSFCGSATCSVVYFGDGGTYRQEDLLVPVFQKCPEGRRTVCYCFAVTEDTVREEIEAGGASPSADRIKALVREGRCACEIRNPQGSCCLGNVGVLVKAAKEPRR
jgi:bacterioferritin-associated ferredoxin